jgi:hypothetical protein
MIIRTPFYSPWKGEKIAPFKAFFLPSKGEKRPIFNKILINLEKYSIFISLIIF